MSACFQAVWQPLQAAIKKPFWDAISVPPGFEPERYKSQVKCGATRSPFSTLALSAALQRSSI